MGQRRLPRVLHPVAWWVWASGLGVAASRTTNPLLLLLLAAIAGYVVSARRAPASPWSRSYAVFLRIALVVLAVRVALHAAFAADEGGHLLFRFPELPLPGWAAGLRIGGPVSAEGLLAAVYDGMRLAVLLVCVGAVNALTSPLRLLRSLPGALYEAGVTVTVALAFAPQTVAAVTRVREARRLRGRPDRGVAGLRGLALPVLEGALERSVELAAALDARGFGRRGTASAARRRLTTALTVTGLLAMCASGYGLLDAGAPVALGLPLLAGGGLVAALGLLVGSLASGRSSYRPDQWRGAEWAVAGSGVLVATAFVVAGLIGTAGLDPMGDPLTLPMLPLLPFAGALLGLLPAWIAPPQPRAQPPRSRLSAPAPAQATS